MKLKDHQYLARRIKLIEEQVHKLLMAKKLKTPEIRRVFNIYRHVEIVKAALDTDYHNIIDDKQFIKLGHIYYGGRKNEKSISYKVPA